MAIQNIFQFFRSAIAGRRPSTNTDHIGVPFVNFPDKQFGVMDAAGVATDLLAVRHYSTTASYKANDLVAKDGIIYKAKAATPPGVWDVTKWGHVITLKLGETATTAYRGDHGKKATDDIAINKTGIATNKANMSVTKFKSAETYVKGALVSYDNDIWFAKANITAGAWNEDEWRPIGIQLLTKDVVATVGTGGDFSTIKEAMTHFANFYPVYGDNGITVELQLMAGYIIKEQIFCDGVNFGWITITSKQGNTPHIVQQASMVLPTEAEGPYNTRYAVFNAKHGGICPGIHFSMELNVAKGVATGRDYMALYAVSNGYISSKNAIIKHFSIGAIIYSGVLIADGTLTCTDNTSAGLLLLKGATVTVVDTLETSNCAIGITLSTSSNLNARDITTKGNAQYGIVLNDVSSLSVEKIIASYTLGTAAGMCAISVRGGSTLSARTSITIAGYHTRRGLECNAGTVTCAFGPININKLGTAVPSSTDILVSNGGVVLRNSGSGGSNIAPSVFNKLGFVNQ